MYKTKLKRSIAVALALIMAAPALVSYPSTIVYATPQPNNSTISTGRVTENNPHATGGRIRGAETEFDPNRPWTQDEEGTIWQDGIPFANMDDIFVWDSGPLQSHRRLNEGRDPVGFQSESQLDRVDQMIRDYVNMRQIPLDQILANSQVEAPFMIINNELVNVPRDGVVLLDFDMDRVHPQARVAPEWIQPPHNMGINTEIRGSRLIPGLVVPEYMGNHPGGWVFVHEMFVPMDTTQMHLHLRPVFPRIEIIGDDLVGFIQAWDEVANPFHKITFLEEFPELEPYVGNIVESTLWYFDILSLETVPYYVLQDQGILPAMQVAPLSESSLGFDHSDSISFSIGATHESHENWRLHFSGIGNITLVFTEFIIQYGHGVSLYAFCAQPWQRTPVATKVDGVSSVYIQGLLALYPWNINTYTEGGRLPVNHATSRNGVGAAAAVAAGITYGIPTDRIPVGPGTGSTGLRYGINEHLLLHYWTQFGDLVRNHPDRYSEATTFTLAGEESRSGTEITVEGERGKPILISVETPDASRLQLAWTVVLADGTPDIDIESNINIAEVNTGGIREFIFTIPEDFEEDSITLIFRPWHGEGVAGGLRGDGGHSQDIWSALPWFWWEITIELNQSLTPIFTCTMAGFPDSDETWEWESTWAWRNHEVTQQEWNDAVAARSEDIEAAGDDVRVLWRIRYEISSDLWKRWAARGFMNMFTHPEHGTLPGGEGNGYDVVMAVVEEICYLPDKLDIFVYPAEAIALASSLGFDSSEFNFECISSIEPLMITAEMADSEDERYCIPEVWEDYAMELGALRLLPMLANMEDCESEPPPCTPSEQEMCGHHFCYIYNRDDNTDEKDQGTTGLQEEEEIELRWNNIPFAFAETHMATSGFNNDGPSTPASNINLTRTSEVFQAMSGKRKAPAFG